MEFLYKLANELGAILGMVYKPSKDELSVKSLDYIGYRITILDAHVTVENQPHKV